MCKVTACPNCFSLDIIYAGETAAYSAFRTGQMYKCKTCGYVGPVILEVSKENYRRMIRHKMKARE